MQQRTMSTARNTCVHCRPHHLRKRLTATCRAMLRLHLFIRMVLLEGHRQQPQQHRYCCPRGRNECERVGVIRPYDHMTAFLLEFIWKGVRCAFFFMHERSGFILLSLDRDLVLFPPPFLFWLEKWFFFSFFLFSPLLVNLMKVTISFSVLGKGYGRVQARLDPCICFAILKD